jgi:oligopeptide/dipeptide ABC transporter ATP-binding protein
VSHDLDLVQRVADDIVVLYGGRTMEQGPVRSILRSPNHPYTRVLLSAIPGDHPRRRHLVDAIGDEVVAAPDEAGALAGERCVFASRCYKALDRCRASRPDLVVGSNGRRHSCFFPETGPVSKRTQGGEDTSLASTEN